MSASKSRAGAPRVGIAGFFIECNRWSPVTTRESFEQAIDLAGEALAEQFRAAAPRTLPDLAGFIDRMDQGGDWTPVALRMAAAQPGGPVDHAYFESLVADIESRLRAAMPLDALFVSSHGAALTTRVDDPDGEFFARLRAVVGPDVPIVAVFDLHTNVSRRMTDALSAFVAYRTNPHVDLRERGEEAAAHLLTLLAKGPGVVEMVKLPLVPPATSQLIAPGSVYAELVEIGQSRVGGDVLNVSMCGGFALADCTKCGFSVVVSAARGARDLARRTAQALAGEVWARRGRFESRLTPLAEAVSAAVEAGQCAALPPLILADVADNPGGGGGGNTVTLLRALLQAGAAGVVCGVQTDAALAAEARELGAGARFVARFNRDCEADRFAEPFEWPARVLATSDGRFVGKRGLLAGSAFEMGPSVLLELDGIRVAVISKRQQLLDPAQLEALGVDTSQVRTLVVKSRGHFRAAFDGFAPPDRILEVDCPGLTTPNLKTLPWTRMPRPVWPIDDEVRWP
ncbi:M81 family metallopeptidase [Burkholderiaceae bacterium FT117]|uniref:M81 family metallopeptidase n=1 Tax=Zeimonas sediminis TaxID=2944268 RepID=UPI0023432167|nr:M81 family metallopeptidase [Zeimonas sediminis]MCM5572140.1 M81 family metallopeptidase [Zeimonas sediminis]